MSSSLTLNDRISLTLDGLCRAVAARVAGGAMAVVMIALVWTRVRRAETRILALLARFQAGRLWSRTVQPGRARPGAARAVGSGPVAAQGLPRGFAWLLPLVPGQAAGYASQLRFMLDDPQMRDLLAASKQARRVLAPLCRMLGIEACVLGGVAAAAACVAVAGYSPVVKKPVRKAKAQIDWGRIPLPRGVLVVARRQGFGKT